jgi:dCMP deaminase
MSNQEKWDLRFLEMAKLVASWSKDPSTKCGAVIVRPDKTIAAVGYNGFPRNVDDSPELYNNREEKYGRVVHAEVNAVLAAKEPLNGYTMYTYPPFIVPSCDRCTTVIVQSGISRVVHFQSDESEFAQRWSDTVARSKEMYSQAGVEIVGYSTQTA